MRATRQTPRVLPAEGRIGDAAAWFEALSRDPRVGWLFVRVGERVKVWCAGERVPERVSRARGGANRSRWIDAAGRCELVVAVAAGHEIPHAEFERWGRIAAALCARGPAAAELVTTNPEFVLHDLAQLLAHAELELGASADGRERATTALRGARALLDTTRADGESRAKAPAPIDLRATLEREAHRAAASAPERGVTLRVRVDPAAEGSLDVEIGRASCRERVLDHV